MPRSFSQLLELYEAGELSGQELEQFFSMLGDEHNRKLLETAIDHRTTNETSPGYENKMLTERALQALMTAIRSENIENTDAAPVRRFTRKTWWAAASVVLLLSAGAYLWFSSHKNKSATKIIAKSADIQPGRSGAILTLSDGSKVLLDSVHIGTILSPDGARIQREDDGITYDHAASGTGAVTYNTMTTPKGRTFQLTLPDGTRAWLNAASSITYPTRFAAKERLVRTTGEIYFEVVKNTGQPFIVQTASDKISVLGTKFNVNAYEDEPAVRTSLLEGSVSVGNHILRPGEAYSNGIVFTENIQKDFAWVKGFFAFQEADLPSVMRQIARWYDVEVKYQGAIPKRTFNGSLGRNLTLTQVLEILQSMRINYTIEKNTLTILPSS